MPTPAHSGQPVSVSAPSGASHHPDPAEEHGVLQTSNLILIGTAALAALLRFAAIPGYNRVALGAVLICGYPIYRETLESLRERRMTMELSMTIALVAAMTVGEVFTALMIVLFVLVAEVIEGLTVGRGRSAIKELLDLLPQTVDVRSSSGENWIRLSDLRIGNVVVVRPGGRIPVDGTVVAGSSFVDQSGALEIEVGAVGSDTAFAGLSRRSKRRSDRALLSRERRTGSRVTSSTSPSHAPP